jgi:putative transposase
VPANPYRGYRFPKEIISQCVWLYFNFALNLRDVELMMAFRGVQLSYETIRRWCDKFGAAYAANSSGGVPNSATNGSSMRCF